MSRTGLRSLLAIRLSIDAIYCEVRWDGAYNFVMFAVLALSRQKLLWVDVCLCT